MKGTHMALWFGALTCRPFDGDETTYSCNLMVEADSEMAAREAMLSSSTARAFPGSWVSRIEQAPDTDEARGMFMLFNLDPSDEAHGDEALRLLGIDVEELDE